MYACALATNRYFANLCKKYNIIYTDATFFRGKGDHKMLAYTLFALISIM